MDRSLSGRSDHPGPLARRLNYARSPRLHSLRWRLPLFFGALVVLMLATFLWATSRAVEGTLVHAGRDRAHAGAEQVAGLLERPIQTRFEENGRFQNNAAIRAVLQNPTDETRAAARAALVPSPTPALRRAELWDASGSLVFAVTTAPPDTATGLRSYPSGARPMGEGVSEIRAAGDKNFFEIVAEIRDDSSRGAGHLGYLRRFGRVTSTPGGAIRRLLGDNAAVKIGSYNGGVWTDFYSVVDAPPANERRETDGQLRAADGKRWVGATDPIEGTPWVAWVGFPRALIVAPAQPFMQRMMLLALLFVAGGVALAAVLGFRLTQPLHALAKASEELAAGDYKRRVGMRGRDEIGQLSGAFDAMADRIEEVHRALKDSYKQTHFALAAARIGVWESQLATGQMICSESMRMVLGSAGPLPESRDAFLAHVHPDDRRSVRGVLEGQSLNGEVVSFQYRALGSDGAVRWIEGKGRIKLDNQGQPISVLGVSADVTDRHRLESQLLQAQKMEAIGQLAGGIAHDFNNLLTAIVGHAELVLPEVSDQTGRDDVKEILKAAHSAAGLTHQLLAFSRRQVLQPEVIVANTVIVNTDKLLRRLIGEHITLVTELAPDLDTIKFDSGQLQQVLVNLAVNARDAMPDGGTLKIASANVTLTEAFSGAHASIEPGDYVMLLVSDTGTGMDEATQARLFEPFFTTKPAGKGTGLGLATVYGIVKQSRGHIYVYSEPGHGTTFKIYLPVTHEAPITGEWKALPPRVTGGSETILVVEDNESVRSVAKTILERIGYRVLVAANGEEALRMVESADASPDLVVSDVIMPGMTGPELGRRLAALHPGVRMLFTSGYSGDDIDRHGLEEPGTLFLEKPYTPSALAGKVREALGHEVTPTT